MLAMRNPWGMGAVLGLALAALRRHGARPTPPFDTAIDVQTFDYAIGPKTFFTVSDADVADKKQLARRRAGHVPDQAVHDLQRRRPSSPTIVGRAHAGRQVAGRGAAHRARTASTTSSSSARTCRSCSRSSGDGLDARRPAWRAIERPQRHRPRRPARRGQVPALQEGRAASIAGIGGAHAADELRQRRLEVHRRRPADAARAASRCSTTSDRSSRSARTAACILRKPRTIYDSTIGQQLTWGVAAAVAHHRAVLADRRELRPRRPARLQPRREPARSRAAACASTRRASVAVVVGGGAGLVKGIGSPRVAVLRLGRLRARRARHRRRRHPERARQVPARSPRTRTASRTTTAAPTTTTTAIAAPTPTTSARTQAEDLDGFDDDDGCPELDNDKDGILDLEDKCPNDAEDGKQPYPKDGCPANKRDSDGDGITDDVDKCPTEEEDMDGFEDGDGCPEADNDDDGVPDATDKCPLCPEDKDGFEDDDGCPELDNDKDGVPDAQGRVPDRARDRSTASRTTTAAPTPAASTIVEARRRSPRSSTRVPTLDGTSAVARPARMIVDQIALVDDRARRGHEVADRARAAEARATRKRLADAIKARLSRRASPADAIQVLGAAGPAKIGGVVQERADGDAAPVCPAGREVKQRPEAAPKATTAGRRRRAARRRSSPTPSSPSRRPSPTNRRSSPTARRRRAASASRRSRAARRRATSSSTSIGPP